MSDANTPEKAGLVELLAKPQPRPDDDELLNLVMELEMETEIPRPVIAYVLQQAVPDLCRRIVVWATDAETSFATRAWFTRLVVDELFRGAKLKHLLDNLTRGDAALLLARARACQSRGRASPERARKVVAELEDLVRREAELLEE